jgi:AP-3 complex subunit delta-1
MLYPIPPPAGFAFHVVEVMSSPRFHLKREYRCFAAAISLMNQSSDTLQHRWHFLEIPKRLS